MVIKHLISNHSKQETCHTNVCLPRLYYRLHLHTTLLATLFSQKYQTHWEYFTRPPSSSTTARWVLRLQMEAQPPIKRVQWIYWVNSSIQAPRSLEVGQTA